MGHNSSLLFLAALLLLANILISPAYTLNLNNNNNNNINNNNNNNININNIKAHSKVLLTTRGHSIGNNPPHQQHSSRPTFISIAQYGRPAIQITPPSPTAAPGNLTLDICLDCVTFMQNNLDTLIYYITQKGVTTTCDKLCGVFNSTVDVGICEGLCDTVGIDKFWQMFVSAGINPIWSCELLSACSVGTNPAVSFSSAGVTPPDGPPGTTFNFQISFTVINETGVGENAFVVYYPTSGDHELGYISQTVFSNYSPGQYTVNMQFATNSSFMVGRYIVDFDICSGACGLEPSPVPFAEDEYYFNITAPSP